VVADEDQIAAVEERVAPLATRRDTPLEHRAWDVHRPRDHPVATAGLTRADVDEERTGRRALGRLPRLEALDPPARVLQELLEGSRHDSKGTTSSA
jgi:hypothetical protein